MLETLKINEHKKSFTETDRKLRVVIKKKKNSDLTRKRASYNSFIDQDNTDDSVSDNFILEEKSNHSYVQPKEVSNLNLSTSYIENSGQSTTVEKKTETSFTLPSASNSNKKPLIGYKEDLVIDRRVNLITYTKESNSHQEKSSVVKNLLYYTTGALTFAGLAYFLGKKNKV